MLRALALLVFTLSVPAAAQHSHDSHEGHGSASGRAADPKKATRTIRVDMTDNMRFTPAEVRVRRGEIVRFVPTNKGQVVHEMVIGTMAELKRHAEKMRAQPHKEMVDEDDHVSPGKSGEVTWQFTEPGEFHYACLIPGHFEAGMIGKVIVSP